jgi:hypothetical protein
MSKPLVNIGFVVVVGVVLAQLGLAIADAGALNRRAPTGNADWSTESVSSPQAALGHRDDVQVVSVPPSPDQSKTETGAGAEPAKPWLGWVFIAFLIAMLLAVRSALAYAKGAGRLSP